VDVVEAILAHEPRIVGIGVYIWNAEESQKLVSDLKRIRPELIVVLGGPEVSYETEQQRIVADADFVITGEGDLAFGELCAAMLSGKRPLLKVIEATLPEFEVKDSGISRSLALPYDRYTDHDLAHRVVYVEASRDCPFKCRVLSLLPRCPLRNVARIVLQSMQSLLDRGYGSSSSSIARSV
jgi:radical SAM superfamily enzyme YgiQ (UPF0313 family)